MLPRPRRSWRNEPSLAIASFAALPVGVSSMSAPAHPTTTFPTDIVLLVALWRLRYKLSLRDLAEMFLERGFEFTHEAAREWEARFAPLLTDKLRAKRKGQAGRS